MTSSAETKSGDLPGPGNKLTIGMAWNGHLSPLTAFEAAQRASFVGEIVVAPMNAAVATQLKAIMPRFSKVRDLPPGDTGLYNALNKIVAATRTSHIVFHGVDDILSEDAVGDIAVAAAIATATPATMVVFSARLCSASGAPGQTFHHSERREPAVTLARYAAPLCPEVAYPVAIVRDVGGFDESFRVAGDADLYFRTRPLCERNDVDRVLVAMRDGGLSASARGARRVWLENRRIATSRRQRVPLRRRLAAYAMLNGRYFLYRIGGEAFADRATDALRALVGRAPRFTLT